MKCRPYGRFFFRNRPIQKPCRRCCYHDCMTSEQYFYFFWTKYFKLKNHIIQTDSCQNTKGRECGKDIMLTFAAGYTHYYNLHNEPEPQEPHRRPFSFPERTERRGNRIKHKWSVKIWRIFGKLRKGRDVPSAKESYERLRISNQCR